MEKIQELYEHTELTIEDIAKKLSVPKWKVFAYITEKYSDEYRVKRKKVSYRNSRTGEKNPSYGKTGKDSPKFIGDISDGKGYILNLKPIWYTGRRGCKHVFKHTVVMCEALGLTEIPAGYCVHHIDRDKTNNTLINLALMSIAAHTRLHQLERATTIRKE